MSDAPPPFDDAAWTADERAAVRAFLQRCEVRLSTVHRVATALLSGAGLMVLLPAIARDSVVSVMSALVRAEADASRALLAVTTLIVLAVPFTALWFVVRDLTRFYFHGHHLLVDQHEVFVPRFTLTALRLPDGELGPGAAAQLAAARADPATIQLLVPSNDASRRRIDRQLDGYGGLGRHDSPGDFGRADGLFALVASRERCLAEEAAKVEHGMARHILRLQVIVLRYVKALLVFLSTALAVFAAEAVTEVEPAVGADAQVWLAAIYAIWAGIVMFTVSSPVRWIEGQLRSEGAMAARIGSAGELTLLERVAVAMSLVGWALSMGALVTVAAQRSLGDQTRAAATVVFVLSLGHVVGVLRWRRRVRPNILEGM